MPERVVHIPRVHRTKHCPANRQALLDAFKPPQCRLRRLEGGVQPARLRQSQHQLLPLLHDGRTLPARVRRRRARVGAVQVGKEERQRTESQQGVADVLRREREVGHGRQHQWRHHLPVVADPNQDRIDRVSNRHFRCVFRLQRLTQ